MTNEMIVLKDMNKEFVISFSGFAPKTWENDMLDSKYQILLETLYSRIANISVEAYEKGYHTIKLVSSLDNMPSVTFCAAADLFKASCKDTGKMNILLKFATANCISIPKKIYDKYYNKADVLIKTPIWARKRLDYLTFRSNIAIFFGEDIPEDLLIEEEDYRAIVIEPSEVEELC